LNWCGGDWRQILIVRYGNIILKTNNGPHEEYECSNYGATEFFDNVFSDFIAAVK
jgi:hypothetical protein